MKVYMGHLKVLGVKNIRYVLLILQSSDLHILHFVYENLLQEFLFTMTRVILNQFHFLVHIHEFYPK